MDVSKGNQKQTVIYWFMFKKFGAKDAVTMIRISEPVSKNETIDINFDQAKNFIEGQLFDAMYKNSGTGDINTAEYIVGQYGNKGLLSIFIVLLIPIGITIVGIRKRE